MSEKKSKRIVAVAAIWIVLLGAAAVLYKMVIVPKEKDEQLRTFGSDSLFTSTVRIAHDSFSGYCVLRSKALRTRLGSRGIRLVLREDTADYAARIQALRDGEVDLALFTIDALIKSSLDIDEFPGTIVLVIDETAGADAVLAYKKSVPDLSALDHASARVVRTPDSPSDTLAHVLYAHFHFSTPLDQWLEAANGADDVLRRLVSDGPGGGRRAYVLWEPYLSKALEDPQVHVLLDSSHLKGYIVDVLVASRDFLDRDGDGVTRALVEDYLRTAYEVKTRPGAMKELVLQDAQEQGAPLDDSQATRLVDGIHWTNTLENYAHFGILPPQQAKGVQHLEEIIRNIVAVLVQTGEVPADNRLTGRESLLFYDRILRTIHDADFHPALLRTDLDVADPIDEDRPLPPLTDDQWEQLVPVGTMRVETIRFGRGTASLNIQSERTLESLAETLKAWPRYYLRVIGHSRREGDPEANRRLADQRARAAAGVLVGHGIPESRIRAEARESIGTGGEAQSVSFFLGQRPY